MRKRRGRIDPKVRIERRSIPEPNSGCWLWEGTVMNSGYGASGTGGKRVNGGQTRGAHQVSWMAYKGTIPDGMFVCHHCDVKICVNPEHLYLATAKKNSEDAVARGRLTLGSDRKNARFSDEDIRTIRRLHAEGHSMNAIGRDYGVNHSHIKVIVRRSVWAHIE